MVGPGPLFLEGQPTRGEIHPLRVPGANTLVSWHTWGYWYVDFGNTIALTLIAMASLVIRIDRT
jgi:hypothetical protein